MLGSNGDVVKMIQHLLYNGGYNQEYSGGGMTGDACYGKWQHCDGKFRRHTKDAVLEFQREYGLKPDGVVGYQTLSKMCEVLSPNSVNSDFTLCERQCRCSDRNPTDNVEINVDIDCEDLRNCVDKYIFGGTTPDMSGFFECYYNSKNRNKQKDSELCVRCKEKYPKGYINLMPSPGTDKTDEMIRFAKSCLKNCDGF